MADPLSTLFNIERVEMTNKVGELGFYPPVRLVLYSTTGRHSEHVNTGTFNIIQHFICVTGQF